MSSLSSHSQPEAWLTSLVSFHGGMHHQARFRVEHFAKYGLEGFLENFHGFVRFWSIPLISPEILLDSLR